MRVQLTNLEPNGDAPAPPPYVTTQPDSVENSSAPSTAGEKPSLAIRSRSSSDELKQTQDSDTYPLFPDSITEYCTSRPFERGSLLQQQGINLPPFSHGVHLGASISEKTLEFPEPLETFLNRDVTFKDWDTFRNHLSLAADHPGLVRGDNLDQRARYDAVIQYWNQHFFGPRQIQIDSLQKPASAVEDAGLVASGKTKPRASSVSSTSTTLSLASSDSSSTASVSSKDLQSGDLSKLREDVDSFRDNLPHEPNIVKAVQDLRAQLRRAATTLPPENRRALKKEFKNEHRELKREIRHLVHEARGERKAQRKAARKASWSEKRELRKACRQSRSAQHNDGQGSLGQTDLPGGSSGSQGAQKAESGPAGPQAQQANAGQPSLLSDGIAQTIGQWVGVGEDACRLAERHLNDVARRIDVACQEASQGIEHGWKTGYEQRGNTKV